MRRRMLVSFAALLMFWILISEGTSLQHIIVGIIICLFTIWFWRDFNPRLPAILSPRELLIFLRSIAMLIGYIIKSNIDVIRILLFSDLAEGSIFLELETDIETEWGRVFLATCITITPGTITIDFDPETNIFAIHAITRDTGISLYYWRIISEIKYLETMVKRREAYAMDTGRIYGSSSTSSTKGNNRAHRN